MKNFLLIVIFFIVCIWLLLNLLKAQDNEFKRYSNNAKKICNENSDMTLVFDKDLQYFKCVKGK